jgi:ribosomal protein L11 methylase PrmA
MEVENARVIDGSKFMWDGVIYETRDQAESVQKEYSEHDFEVRLVQEEDQWLLYTRRVVTEIVLEGEAPP